MSYFNYSCFFEGKDGGEGIGCEGGDKRADQSHDGADEAPADTGPDTEHGGENQNGVNGQFHNSPSLWLRMMVMVQIRRMGEGAGQTGAYVRNPGIP